MCIRDQDLINLNSFTAFKRTFINETCFFSAFKLDMHSGEEYDDY